jgi:rubredoxin
MSEERPTSARRDEIEDVLSGLWEWRRQHPQATMAEIERETMKRMAQLQARLVEELSQGLPGEAQEAGRQDKVICPECGSQMQSRGQVARQLQGAGAQDISLKREYWVCPVCGTGIFPPG